MFILELTVRSLSQQEQNVDTTEFSTSSTSSSGTVNNSEENKILPTQTSTSSDQRVGQGDEKYRLTVRKNLFLFLVFTLICFLFFLLFLEKERSASTAIY
jgi:hypothetical protein